MLDNLDAIEEQEDVSFDVLSYFAADCYQPAEKSFQPKPSDVYQPALELVSHEKTTGPIEAALEILGTANIKKRGDTVLATLPRKTYLTVDEPGLKQLSFAKEMSMKVTIGADSIKLSGITGLDGRPPFVPKIGGWVGIKDIDVTKDRARITCGKFGAKFHVNIPLGEGDFEQIKDLLKKYDIR